MSCPASPEGGFHRFKLAPKGLEFETRCVYCGAEKLLKPFEETVPPYRRNMTHRPSADERRVILPD